MLDRFAHALEGPNGLGFDTARILFFTGGVGLVFGPLVFQTIAVLHGQAWDPASFCGGYGAGLAAYLGGGGLGISLKDRGVASALVATGAPAAPPSPPAQGNAS